MVLLHLSSFIVSTALALFLLSTKVNAVPHHHDLMHRHVSPARRLMTLRHESLARRDQSTPVERMDISLIPCRGTVNGTAAAGKPNSDISASVGHEAGLQLSQPGRKAFQCAANT
jgi:hypothetical protein